MNKSLYPKDTRIRIGLIINPTAGVGGRGGFKGSDGTDIQLAAKDMGYASEAPARVTQALHALLPVRTNIELYSAPGEMGEYVSRNSGFLPIVTGYIKYGQTTSADTIRIARELVSLGISLLIFAGGDGTARDICQAIGTSIPVLGVPAGVKIHSAVYAVSPRAAGEVLLKFISGQTRLSEAEVMDIDEMQFRQGIISTRLYGYLLIPQDRLMQSGKAASHSGTEALLGLAGEIVAQMQPDIYYLVGPGTTMQAIFSQLGLPKTLLGVDILLNRKLTATDANEQQILELIRNKPSRIIVTVIGGQGHIFGRGNQQLSPRVITSTGRENILLAATQEKLSTLRGSKLLVDTGDELCDQMLCGYYRVVVDYEKYVVCRVTR